MGWKWGIGSVEMYGDVFCDVNFINIICFCVLSLLKFNGIGEFE